MNVDLTPALDLGSAAFCLELQSPRMGFRLDMDLGIDFGLRTTGGCARTATTPVHFSAKVVSQNNARTFVPRIFSSSKDNWGRKNL